MPARTVYHSKLKASIKGITLVELLACLAIVSILSFIVIPSLNDMLQNARSSSHINQLSQLIRFTRNEALARGSNVTLCPTSQGLNCEGAWHSGIMIFVDENNNQERNENEPLLRLKTPFLETGSIEFNSPTKRVVFSRQGFPRGNAGSFVYCPENNNEEYARALILNFQGRLRLATDQDGDGIIETTRGNNVQCG